MKTIRRFVATASALLLSATLLAGCGEPPPNPLSAEEQQLIRDMHPLNTRGSNVLPLCTHRFIGVESCHYTLGGLIRDTQFFCGIPVDKLSTTLVKGLPPEEVLRVNAVRAVAKTIPLPGRSFEPTEEDLTAALPQVQQLHAASCPQLPQLQALRDRLGGMLPPDDLAAIQRSESDR